MIPGPNSTQIVMLCGLEYGGFWGMIMAGIPLLILCWFFVKRNVASYYLVGTAFVYGVGMSFL